MKFNLELPVQFRDIDCLGHVNSAAYLQYMESARIEFMRSLGRIGPGYRPPLIVASCRCEYRKPIVDEREVKVSLWVSRIGTRSWDFDYTVQGLNGILFAAGRTTQVAFDYDSTSAMSISNDFRGDLERYAEKPLEFKEGA